jgi:hypothetical protein
VQAEEVMAKKAAKERDQNEEKDREEKPGEGAGEGPGESDTATAVAEVPYNIKVEDAGPATKKIWVEIPKEKVAEKIAEQFKELRQGAHIPGFRKGKAPQKLIEKKFSADVKEQVRRTLISESYEQAI